MPSNDWDIPFEVNLVSVMSTALAPRTLYRLGCLNTLMNCVASVSQVQNEIEESM